MKHKAASAIIILSVFSMTVSSYLMAHEAVKPVVSIKATPLPLTDVRLTGGPLKDVQDQDIKYLLELEPDRMMAFLREAAGLEAKAKGYNGWDGNDRQLTGHIAGHYLSAVSLMYAATGDPRFKERADYLVNELKVVQDKQGDGYIGAQIDRNNVPGKTLYLQVAAGDIRSGGFDLNGMWSPWYVQHKIFAGLRDAYRYAGNQTALEVEIKFAAWAESILAKLSDEQVQKMLNTEFGGMNEVMVDLYADTGDKRWLAVADKFQHHAIIDPLARGEDILEGKHGNTQVPKLMGSLVKYEYTGSKEDGKAAKFFWDRVALHHSFATGGHGRNEYFGAPDILEPMIEGRTAETCNVYNMIKMARSLFALEPDIKYADFHERALYNHILGSMDPADGSTCYMVPVGQGVIREYQNMQEDFTCCVGTGMESHALHAYGIYYESGNMLWVNLYAPTTAAWKSHGVDLKMETSFPEGDDVSLTLDMKEPKALTLALRRPAWAAAGFVVKVNGEAVKEMCPVGHYVKLERTWKTGDKVELTLPKTLHLEPLPDNPDKAAIMWGPLVLAGDLGKIPEWQPTEKEWEFPASKIPAVPVLVAKEPADVAAWLKPVEGKPGTFRTTEGVGRDKDMELVPFYRLQRRIYAATWDVLTPEKWKKRAADILAAKEETIKIEAMTVAFIQPGQMQAERDFNMQGGKTMPVQFGGKYGRRAEDWFSFDLPVDPSSPLQLVVTYNTEERGNRNFAILADGQKIGEQKIARR
ncbi:MAG: glycoside hydrolase family 127 protein, partial [Candidatus Aminicenantes bacterium]|nr:glycoside hydrolase family 127 protein [Candidatus Aminicenantes bacterium]